MGNFIDIKGEKYNRLKVIKKYSKGKRLYE